MTLDSDSPLVSAMDLEADGDVMGVGGVTRSYWRRCKARGGAFHASNPDYAALGLSPHTGGAEYLNLMSGLEYKPEDRLTYHPGEAMMRIQTCLKVEKGEILHQDQPVIQEGVVE